MSIARRTVFLSSVQALGHRRRLLGKPTLQFQRVGCIAVYHVNTLSSGQVPIIKDYQLVFTGQQSVKNNTKRAPEYAIWGRESGSETLSPFSFW